LGLPRAPGKGKTVRKTIPLLLVALFAAQSLFGDASFTRLASAASSIDISADEPRKAPLFQDTSDAISIYVMVACEDPALEAAIRVIAQDKIRSLEHAGIAGSMEESAVLLSFSAFRARIEENEQIVYSFAYGTPDTEFVDDVPVSLPRYIYHESVMTRPDDLASCINGNIAAVDSDFIRHLR
jgi:hypothetical protein